MNVRLHIERLVVDERLLRGRTPRAFERELAAAVERLVLDGELDPARLRGGARPRVRVTGAASPPEGDALEDLARTIVRGVRDG